MGLEGGYDMKFEELIDHAKQLQLTDEREIFIRVIIPYPLIYRLFRSTNRSYGRQMGRNGFIGLYDDQFVCYNTNMWGTVPADEKLRFKISDIEHMKTKLGYMGFNRKLLIYTAKHKYTYYYRKKFEEKVDLMIHEVTSKK